MSWVSETDVVRLAPGRDCLRGGSTPASGLTWSSGMPMAWRFSARAASTRDAARNQAEYLRLLLSADHIPAVSAELKPFALVVEDDVENCDALTEALKLVGIRALGVHSGMEAVRLARALTPDLVVIDYRLPDISGAEVCRRLRNDPETEALPVIAVTGSPEELRKDGCSADAVLAKPCGLDTFTAAVRLFLRAKVEA